MAAAAGVLPRVAIGRRVTTSRPTAGLTRSQMHPLRSHIHAFLTHARSGRRDGVHGVDVRAATPTGRHQRSSTFTLSASLDMRIAAQRRRSAAQRLAAPQDSTTRERGVRTQSRPPASSARTRPGRIRSRSVEASDSRMNFLLSKNTPRRPHREPLAVDERFGVQRAGLPLVNAHA